ncbi:hypothetical protein HDV01_004369 [Terramyces sp. JEL0728]|nr:hypothetical protein HDV01_004369 [Terramyces sp. JEL0728]
MQRTVSFSKYQKFSQETPLEYDDYNELESSMLHITRHRRTNYFCDYLGFYNKDYKDISTLLALDPATVTRLHLEFLYQQRHIYGISRLSRERKDLFETNDFHFLALACIAGDIPLATNILSIGSEDPNKLFSTEQLNLPSNPHPKDGFGVSMTPLALACSNGHRDIVSMLLQCDRLDPNTTMPFERYVGAMVNAVKLDDYCILSLLLQDGQLDPTLGLEMAISLCKYEALQLFLQDTRVDLKKNDYIALQTLPIGVETGNSFLKQLVNDQIVHPFTELLLYSYKWDLQKVRELIKQGMDPGFSDNFVFINFCGAPFGDVSEFVKELLHDPRVDPSARNDLALVKACQNLNFAVCDLLLQDQRVKNTWTALVTLLSQSPTKETFTKTTDLAKRLLTHPQYNPSVSDNQVFILACKHGMLDLVELLALDQRVDPSADNSIALYYACDLADHLAVQIVKILRKCPRLNPSAENNRVLKKACLLGKTAMVKWLIRDNRLTVENDLEECYAIAAKEGYNDIIDLLQQKFPHLNSPA